MWMRQSFIHRPQKGLYRTLVQDLQLHDSEYFFKCFRMSLVTFKKLLSWVAPFIKKSSSMRAVSSPDKRLVVTLHYLVTGEFQTSIQQRTG